jgi:ubiquitin carboxyl-terminal hydrolase L3
MLLRAFPIRKMGKSDAADEKQKGPLDRGLLGPDEDVLSPKAIELGIGRVIKMEVESGGGDLRFSCIALAKEPAAG